MQIHTTVLRDFLRQRGLWPPTKHPLHREFLVLVPRVALQQHYPQFVGLLAEEDWFLDGGGPCLILGDAAFGSDGKYYPQESYAVAEALRLTRAYRQPQREAEHKQQQATAQRQHQEQLRQQREEQWRVAALREQQEATLRAAQRANPLAEVQQRLEQLEAQLRGNAPNPVAATET